MKSFITALAITFGLVFSAQATEAPKIDAPKIKRVCKDSKDKKGKDVKVCKDVKIHKKHEGTKVPEKAPAKK